MDLGRYKPAMGIRDYICRMQRTISTVFGLVQPGRCVRASGCECRVYGEGCGRGDNRWGGNPTPGRVGRRGYRDGRMDKEPLFNVA